MKTTHIHGVLVMLAAALAVTTASPPAAAAPMADLFAKLPAGARTAVSIDMKKLRATPHFDEMVGLLGSIKDLGAVRLESGSGLDPKTDIDALAIVLMGNGDGVGIARGKKLDEAKTRKYYKGKDKSAFKEEKVEGKAVMKVGKDTFIAFVGKHEALVGSKKLVDKALKVLAGKGTAVTRSGPLVAPLKVVGSDGPVWAIGTVPESDRKSLKKKGRTTVAGVKQYFVRSDFTAGVSIKIRATCTTDEACKKLHDSIKKGIDGAKEKTALKLLGVSSYLDKVSMFHTKNDLRMDITLDELTFTTLLAVGPKVYAILR